MDALEVLKKRRSIRSYKDKPIAKAILEQIIDTARYAPTARNLQPWEFVVVTLSDTLKKISDLTDNGKFIGQAKACIAVFCQDTKYYLEDGCAATVNILLAATALGLGSCWVAGDKKPYCSQIIELLDVPASFKLVSLVALGYLEPSDSFQEAAKKNPNQLMHWEKF
ncbi:nitroreductase family protein [bacterium]|nr:MAG: nitroreductase family protein [bacterium]